MLAGVHGPTYHTLVLGHGALRTQRVRGWDRLVTSHRIPDAPDAPQAPQSLQVDVWAMRHINVSANTP